MYCNILPTYFRCSYHPLQVMTTLLAVLLLGNLYLLAAEKLFGISNPTFFGFTTAIVNSGSMEPALKVDDLILIHAQDGYEQGDVITYQSDGGLVTHRIVEIRTEGFVTQGDANNAVDSGLVASEEIVGKVTGRIPGAGIWVRWLRSPLGMTGLVLVGLLLVERPWLFRRSDCEDREKGGVQV